MYTSRMSELREGSLQIIIASDFCTFFLLEVSVSQRENQGWGGGRERGGENLVLSRLRADSALKS